MTCRYVLVVYLDGEEVRYEGVTLTENPTEYELTHADGMHSWLIPKCVVRVLSVERK